MAKVIVVGVLLLIIYLFSCIDAKKQRKSGSDLYVVDELLKACLVHDVVRVKELLEQDPHELSARSPVLVNRVEENYGRTSVMVCGSDPQKKDVQAIDSDCLEITKLLHKSGAWLNVSDISGWDVLSLASYRGFTQVTKYLLETQETNIDHQDLSNRTSLMKAIMHGHVETCQLLLKAGARLDLQDLNGLYALHYAALASIKNPSTSSLFRNLLALHSNSNSAIDTWIDDDGRTVLMYAAIGNSLDVVDAILQYHVDTQRMDQQGMTAAALTTSAEVKSRLQEAYLQQVDRQHNQWLKSQELKLQGELILSVELD